jgi:hypothetical protein
MNNAVDGLDTKMWKDKYELSWCDLCDVAVITCPECKNSSCNSGSCDKCKEDMKEFSSYKCKVQNYLSEDEIKVYEKSLRIKRHILNTIPLGIKEIDWKKLQSDGELSEWEESLFSKELKI